MSPRGLQKFLDGVEPYSATRRKLERWYVHETASGYASATGQDAGLAALRVLTQPVPPGQQAAAM
jgi:hypothetical protein